MTSTVTAPSIDKNMDTARASVANEINGVRAGSRRPLVSIITASQQARAGLLVRRSMV
jgi:hypothetical protein